MVLSAMLVPVALSGRWTQDDALDWLASRDKAPERNDQFACQRGPREGGDHCLARADPAISGAGAIPQCQRALLLKQQKAPGELGHAAADPGVAGSGGPCSRRRAPLSSGAPVRPAPGSGLWPGPRTGSAGHCSAVTHWPGQNLMDQHISRFDTNTDDPGQ